MKSRHFLAALACVTFAGPALAQEAPAPDSSMPVLVSFTENNGAASGLLSRGGSYSFAPTNTRPVIVTDLSANVPVRRVSARYKGPAGRFDFYVLEGSNKLGETRDSAGVRRVSFSSVSAMIDAAPAERRTPVASIRVARTNDFVEVRRFVGPIVGRYIIAMFTPDNGSGRLAVRGDGKTLVTSANDGKSIVGSEPGSTPTISEYNPGGYNPELSPPTDILITGINPPRTPDDLFVPPPNIAVPPPAGIPPISR